MTIHTNTDKSQTRAQNNTNFFTARIIKSLKRLESHINRIGMLLKRDHEKNNGMHNISWFLNARLERMQLIPITNQENTRNVGVRGALNKANQL
ncbi:HPF/RaiA family ribosome-associated protein [Formosa undariae]|uniref:HPF/RaiA family ribosome-associated protein n=1 Tax=Formosa undariae TaxID=1325436 RepID=A0ABV5EY72_9FLAO